MSNSSARLTTRSILSSGTKGCPRRKIWASWSALHSDLTKHWISENPVSGNTCQSLRKASAKISLKAPVTYAMPCLKDCSSSKSTGAEPAITALIIYLTAPAIPRKPTGFLQRKCPVKICRSKKLKNIRQQFCCALPRHTANWISSWRYTIPAWEASTKEDWPRWDLIPVSIWSAASLQLTGSQRFFPLSTKKAAVPRRFYSLSIQPTTVP